VRTGLKTFSLSAKAIEKKWYIVDAKDLVVGRLATFLVNRLRGKHLPIYTPHLDAGDNLVVINASQVHFSGKKWKNKIYYKHTNYPGGIKETTADHVRCGRFPERVLIDAVRRMMDQGPLRRARMKHLFVYPDSFHPHQAQQPIAIDVGSLHRKNRCTVS